MKRVFVDMDGVLVNFEQFMNDHGLTGDQAKRVTGAFLLMEPYPDAIAGIRSLLGAGYEVWIATKPPTGIASAYAEKAQWIFTYLPELKRKIIITHDKGLLGDEGDFLVDDRPHKANCDKFRGTLIPFTNGETWAGVIDKIRSKHYTN